MMETPQIPKIDAIEDPISKFTDNEAKDGGSNDEIN
jgi:hypothetical protein